MNKTCIIIPTYNHSKALPHILSQLSLDVLIVNDGSTRDVQEELFKLGEKHSNVSIIDLTENKGKGYAVKTGLQWAYGKGYTHAFQIDADGQHDMSTLSTFLSLSHNNPHAVISGLPQYDASAPFARRFGRWMTNVWVWVETLSFRIKESMCGYRVYPLRETIQLLNISSLGNRMEFDTEILVRLFWRGIPCIMCPVSVTYPTDNTSAFDMIGDNCRITKMHTCLVFKMLLFLPSILRHRPNYKALQLQASNENWFHIREQGSVLGLRIMFTCYRFFGHRLCKIIALPILLYYFMTTPQRRAASREYLSRVFCFSGKEKRVSILDVFNHYLHFLEMMLDKLGAWTGKITPSNIENEGLSSLQAMTAQQRGGVFLVNHLGNVDILRACASFKEGRKLHVLLHSKNAEKFNHVLNHLNPKNTVNTLEVSQIGPDSICYLKDKIENGEWVAIAADRLPVTGTPHVSHVSFLGQLAPFPQGSFILASLLNCPVFSLTILRQHCGTFKLNVEKLADTIQLTRATREQDISEYVKKYSKILEKHCISHPYQWFNFYHYWNSNNA